MDKLRALAYCLAAADGGSLSAAARRLDVTVAAVSKLISAFERELGFRLFERRASGLIVTGAGASFLESGRETLARLAEAEDMARTAASGLKGTVVVGVQPTVAQEVLCESLPQFHAKHPDIQLDPPSVRRLPRVRAFIEFATRLFENVEQLRSNRLPATASPEWLAARRTRASRSL